MQVITKYIECFKDTPLTLISGKTLGPITLAYQTYGTLSDAKDNVIWICHALTGNAHAAFQDEDGNKGWWYEFIGPGKPIDTNKYFVVSSNVIGSCKGSTGPSSLNPATNQPYGLEFPVITVNDMIHAQKALFDHLKIASIKMVIGGSMGGMQALAWAIMYPALVTSCVSIAATTKLSPQALAFDAVGREAIMTDANWNQGKYHESSQPEKGLAIARMIGHITYLSDESMAIKFGRNLQQKTEFDYDHTAEFEVESYLQYQGNKFVSMFDPNSYLYMTKAISYFDLEKTYGSLEKAFTPITAKLLVISIASDWLYTSQDSKSIVKTAMKLNKDVSFCELDSAYGHDAFLLDNTKLNKLVSVFLEKL